MDNLITAHWFGYDTVVLITKLCMKYIKHVFNYFTMTNMASYEDLLTIDGQVSIHYKNILFLYWDWETLL